MQPQIAPPSGVERPRKKRGCLIATIVLMVLVAIPIVALVVMLGPMMFGVFRGTQKLITNGKNAPGVKELEASLCDQAIVTDLDELHRLSTLMASDAGPRANPDVRFNVACFVNHAPKAPLCEDVASRYGKAVGPGTVKYNVVVRVGRARDGSTLVCSKLHGPDHASLGDTPEILD